MVEFFLLIFLVPFTTYAVASDPIVLTTTTSVSTRTHKLILSHNYTNSASDFDLVVMLHGNGGDLEYFSPTGFSTLKDTFRVNMLYIRDPFTYFTAAIVEDTKVHFQLAVEKAKELVTVRDVYVIGKSRGGMRALAGNVGVAGIIAIAMWTTSDDDLNSYPVTKTIQVQGALDKIVPISGSTWYWADGSQYILGPHSTFVDKLKVKNNCSGVESTVNRKDLFRGGYSSVQVTRYACDTLVETWYLPEADHYFDSTTCPIPGINCDFGPKTAAALFESIRGQRMCESIRSTILLVGVVRIFRTYLNDNPPDARDVCFDGDQNGQISLAEVVEVFRAYLAQ